MTSVRWNKQYRLPGLSTGRLCRSTIALFFALIWGAVAGCDQRKNVPDTLQGDPSHIPAASPFFSDVTSEAGLSAFRHETGAFGEKWFPETMGGGGGFIDYDGDGWPDILLIGGSTWHEERAPDVSALHLYRNRGDGTFIETTEPAGLDGITAYGMGITVSDYDNDGDSDIFLTSLRKNLLLRNEDGVFEDVTAQAGLGIHEEWSTAALFFDADRDGHLDLFVGNYVNWSPDQDIFCTLNGSDKSYCTPEEYEGLPPRYFRNDGDGTFSERTEAAGFRPAPGKALGAAMLDYNQDGWIDLVVANDQQRDLLYENRGDGTFVERGILSGIAFNEEGKARAGMGTDAGVVDETGQETVFIGNFSNEMIGVYRHLNGGFFVDRAALSRIGFPSLLTLTFGLFLIDADLDGDLDLFAANGHVQKDIETVRDNVSYRQRPQLFVNKGGDFDVHTPVVAADNPLAKPIVARGAAYADIDLDGDQDILVTENGGPVHVWRNNARQAGLGDAPHALRIVLEGREGNRDAIGAVVEATVAVTDAQYFRLRRRVKTGSSYLSHSESVLAIGLGTHTHIDSLSVYWPSGQVSRYTGIRAGRILRIVEGDSEVHPLADSFQ